MLSYHGPDGAAIADTTTITGGGILKPTGDDTTGTAANARWKKNITYVRIKCALNCNDFIPAMCQPVNMETGF